MEDIAQIVKDIVSQIDTTITGVFNIGTGKTDYCATKWARIGKTVTDSLGNTYLIDEVITNESLTVTQTSAPPLVDLDGVTFLPPPFWQSGTKLAANMEWTKAVLSVIEKTPLIWLLEVLREKPFGRGDVREFEIDLRLFFLDETNVKDFYTEDHRREVVTPMRALAEAFLDVVRNDRQFKTLEDYTITSFSRFGVETDKGVIANILDANLAGVELQFTLTKYKENNCKTNC